MNEPWKNVMDKLRGWGTAFIEMLPNLAVAILIVIAFVILARIAVRITRPALGRISSHKQLRGLALSVLKTGIFLLGVFIALGVLNLDGTVASLLAGVGVIGLALGFAFQDIAANFMSGIILAVREPFHEGDMVTIGSFEGNIERLDLRATVGRTFQGQIVTIPNKDVLGSHIINFTTSREWRVHVDIGVSYGDDLDAAEAAVKDALESVSERDESKPVDVWYTGFGDSSINISARMWIRNDTQSFLLARSQMVKALKKTFDERDLTIPFPIRTLDFGIVGGKELSEVLPQVPERDAA